MSDHSQVDRQESNGTNKSEEFTFTYSGTSQHNNNNNNNSTTNNPAGGINPFTEPAITVQKNDDDDDSDSSASSGLLPTNLQAVAEQHQQQKDLEEEEKRLAAEAEARKKKQQEREKQDNMQTSSSGNNMLAPSNSSVQGRRMRSHSGVRKSLPKPSDSVQKEADDLKNKNKTGEQQANANSSAAASNNNNRDDEPVSNRQPARDLPWSFSALTDKSCFNSLLERNVGVTSEQGLRRSMEDQHCAIISDKNGQDTEQTAQNKADIPFFAVYDGHGGVQCADFLRANLHGYIMSQPNIRTEPELAIQTGVLKAEEIFMEKSRTEKLEAGSTVALAIILDGKLIVGNVGDSEIVLSRGGKAELLTTKHHLSCNKNEAARIKAAGGRTHRDRVGHPKFNPAIMNIAVTRAIGDAGFKLDEYTDGNPSGLIADAETRTIPLTSDDEFIVIGCDGLWDVMTYQDCIDFCRSNLTKGANAQQVTEALVAEALDRQSSDNITVMFVNLRERGATPLSRSASASANNNNTSARGSAPVSREESASGNNINNNTTSNNSESNNTAGGAAASTTDNNEKSKTFSVDNWDYDGS